MKIDLIIPPDPFLGDDKRNSPLGLLYIAAVSKQAGHDVNIKDLRGKEIDDLKDLDFEREVYGITSSTPSYYSSGNLAKRIKSQNSTALTVLGGIHATALPNKIGPEFDKVVIGEGENSFLEILKDNEKKENK